MAYKKMSAYDKINKRFAKLSGGQSLEDRAKYWQKEKEKTQAALVKHRAENPSLKKEGTYANFSKRRAAQLTPKEKDKANANYKQRARDDIKKKQLARAYGISEASTGVVDIFMIYQFIKRLATPFNRWDAYKSGVIDQRGNIKVLERRRDRKQKESFKIFDLLVLRLKKLLEKIPGGKTRLASYAAALMLIKEDWSAKSESQVIQESNGTFADYLRLYKLDDYAKALEEMPTNSMGAGNIAGGGINGPDDVKVTKKKAKSYKQMNKKDAANYHSGIKTYVNSKFNGMF